MDRSRQNARLRNTFTAHLAAEGLRCTPERLRVLNAVLDLNGHFGADSVVVATQQPAEGILVSRATVFNTLPLLERCGVIRRLAHDRHVSYEVVRQSVQLKARQHLRCLECGRVQRLQAPLLSAWVSNLTFRDFAPKAESAVLYLDGLCNKCRRKRNANK